MELVRQNARINITKTTFPVTFDEEEVILLDLVNVGRKPN
jgi:hypothetical protein